MIYVGIDQSFTCSGIVILDEDYSMLGAHTIETKVKEYSSNFFRAKHIANTLLEIIEGYSPDYKIKVGIEGLPYGARSNVTRNLAGLQYAIATALPDHVLLELEEYPPTSVKKFATGNGRAEKEDLFQALPPDVKSAFEEIPKTRGRYDLTDAYFIAKLRRLSDGESNLNRH